MFKLLVMGVLVLGALNAAMHFVSGANAPNQPPPQLSVPMPFPGATEIRVEAQRENAYGQPWHGVGGTGIGVGGLMLLSLPTTSPPDLDLCVVTVDGGDTNVACNGRKSGTWYRAMDSLCPNNLSCSWSVKLPKGPFGLIAINLDFGAADANDLVDVLLVAQPGQDISEVSDAVRAALPMLARTRVSLPTWTRIEGGITIAPQEERRRQTPFPVVDRKKCKDGCQLSQSTFYFADGS